MAIEEPSSNVRSARTSTESAPEPAVSGHQPRDLIRSLIPRLFQPIDNASIVFFRIGFGLTSFFHVWGILDANRVRRRYIDPPFLFSYPGLDWVKRLPGDWMLALWFALAAAALLIMLGLFYKSATIFFFVGHTYAIHLDQSVFWNHYYVVSLFAFLMIFIPANRATRWTSSYDASQPRAPSLPGRCGPCVARWRSPTSSLASPRSTLTGSTAAPWPSTSPAEQQYLYWNLSAWNDYQVRLMRTDLTKV